ncbi:uncharacterized protein LOC124280606 isoform X1 [Haliotis rubra]|uniref:uncharacterized protein LOC124280606 isoform X1 n=1 Tax=Haliotis rubra TaxID=36100 RepID=UPI001EE548FF|nr:uncharacterized protein LOC124280606 isoform X1 [Haliotis rubra]
MNVRVIFLCELVAWCAYLHNADSLHSGECYGSGNRFHLSCGTDSRIALDNIYVIALSTDCSPGVQVKDTPTCCEADMDVHDCKMNLIGENVNNYHELCSGRPMCDKEVALQDIICGLRTWKRASSNYITFEYHCVEASGIVDIPSNHSANETVVSIWNKGYPTSGLNASAAMCSVTASHNSSIAVSLLHLNITCQQYIDILDGSFRERIDCRNNTNYSSGTLYTSRNHVISLNWTSELTASGRLWIQFAATNSLANLELRCVSSSTTARASGSIQPNAPSHLDTTTLLISSPRGGMSLAEAAGIGVGVVVSFLLLLILVCFLHKKKHQRVKVGNQGGDVLDSEFADALGITRANMGSTAPVSVIPPKARRLAPIEVPGTGIHL